MERIVFTNAPKPMPVAPSDCGMAIKISQRRMAGKVKPKATRAKVIKLTRTRASKALQAVTS